MLFGMPVLGTCRSMGGIFGAGSDLGTCNHLFDETVRPEGPKIYIYIFFQYSKVLFSIRAPSLYPSQSAFNGRYMYIHVQIMSQQVPIKLEFIIY